MRAAIWLILCWCSVARADPAAIDDARRSLQALDFSGALAKARSAIDAGGHTPAELSELYAIIGEAASVSEGAQAGEAAFRIALSIAPARPAPSRSSPVVQTPFGRARQFTEKNGVLRASHAVETQRGGLGFRVAVRVESDPLGLVARRQLWWRDRGGAFNPAVLEGDLFVVPLRPGLVEYYAQLVDAHGNVLSTIGEAQRPRELMAAPGPVHHPLRIAGIATGVGGLALGITGLSLNLVYQRDYAHLQSVCAAACQPSQLSALDVDRGVAIAGYATGGALLATAAVLLAIDAWQSRSRADAPTSSPRSRASR
jgi:hypothetical protein